MVLGVILALPAAGETVGAGEPAPEHLVRPAVEYQANLRIESGHLVLSGPVHFTPDKEKRTLTLDGSRVPGQSMIIRRDKSVVWILNPEHKSYYQVPLSSESASSHDVTSRALIEKVEVGRETIDGVEATKYRVKFAEVEGAGLGGHLWLSAANIVLRVEGTTVDRERNRSRPFRMRLENLKLAPQAPDLFEVPTGFTQVTPGHPTLGIMAPPPRRP